MTEGGNRFPDTGIESISQQLDTCVKEFEEHKGSWNAGELQQYWEELQSYQTEVQKWMHGSKRLPGWLDLATRISYAIIAAENAIEKAGIIPYVAILRSKTTIREAIGINAGIKARDAVRKLSAALRYQTLSDEESKEVLVFLKEFGPQVSSVELTSDDKNALHDGLWDFVLFLKDEEEARTGNEEDGHLVARDIISKFSQALDPEGFNESDRKIALDFYREHGFRL